ncbi:MAG: flagellar hook-length control protein FliK [Thermodesulforhabdaceae bacterium]
MLPNFPRIVQNFEKQTSGNSAPTSRKVSKTAGKNFLVSFMSQAQEVQDKRTSVIQSRSEDKNLSRKDNQEKSVGRDENRDNSKIHNVVNEMGLSYFFVLQDDQQHDPLVENYKTDQQMDLSMDFKEASQLLAKLGFSADDIDALQAEAMNSQKLDLQMFLNFLNSRTPSLEGLTIRGDDLSKILSGISFNGNSLNFSLDPEKQFSLDEVKSILNRVIQTPQETTQDMVDVALKKPTETTISSEEPLSESTNDQKEIYQKDLKDAFARTLVSNYYNSSDTQPAQNQNVQFQKTGSHDTLTKVETIISSEEPLSESTSNQREIYQNELKDAFARTLIPDRNSPNTQFIQNQDVYYQLHQKNMKDLLDKTVTPSTSTSTAFNNPASQASHLPDGSEASQTTSSLAGNIQNYTNKSDETVRLFTPYQGSESQATVTQISTDSFSGSGDSKFSHSFFSNQNAQNILLESNNFLGGLLGNSQSFGQVLNQAQTHLSPTLQVTSQAVMASQLAERIQQMTQEGKNQLILQLEPKELGRIVVKLSARENKITTHIKTEDERVRDLLQKNSEALKQYLEEQGLMLDDFSVETENGRGNAHNNDGNYGKNAYFTSGSDTVLDPQLTVQTGITKAGLTNTGGHLIYFYA